MLKNLQVAYKIHIFAPPKGSQGQFPQVRRRGQRNLSLRPFGVTTPLGVACYQLQEVYERTMLEIKQQALEEKQGDNRQVKRLNGRQNLVKLSCIIERQVYQTERLVFR